MGTLKDVKGRVKLRGNGAFLLCMIQRGAGADSAGFSPQKRWHLQSALCAWELLWDFSSTLAELGGLTWLCSCSVVLSVCWKGQSVVERDIQPHL